MSTPSLDFIDYPESELVIGLIAPTGTNTDYIENELTDRLTNIGYRPEKVRLSEILERTEFGKDVDNSSSYLRTRTLMDAGDLLREKTGRGDALALLAVQEIAKKRNRTSDDKPEPSPKKVYILRSLKHPAEAIALRRIYREGFFLLGIFSPEKARLSYLKDHKFLTDEQANELILRDQSEDLEMGLGQETRDTFHLADAFIDLSIAEDAKVQLWRIIDLIFRNPFETPTPDEHAMYLAYATSFRSADLSRQVGAVVTSSEGEILAVGTNDVPCFGGGLYHSESDTDYRDYKLGVDSNAQRKKKIIDDITDLVKTNFVPQDYDEIEKKGGVDNVIKTGVAKTLLSYITEFGRPVHAEMEALLSCARKAVSPSGGTLYTTTFPCHNCAKHIVDAGIIRVVYVEPYPKSLAGELYEDSIDLEGLNQKKVKFEPFVGIGSRRFMDLFSMGLSTGHPVERKKKGSIEKIDWQIENSKLRVPMLPTSYLEREEVSALVITKRLEDKSNDDTKNR